MKLKRDSEHVHKKLFSALSKYLSTLHHNPAIGMHAMILLPIASRESRFHPTHVGESFRVVQLVLYPLRLASSSSSS